MKAEGLEEKREVESEVMEFIVGSKRSWVGECKQEHFRDEIVILDCIHALFSMNVVQYYYYPS